MIRMLVLCLYATSMFVTQAYAKQPINLLDKEERMAANPIWIAHRGGVIGPNAPECSLNAIRLAAEKGYEIVELDVRESLDHIPIYFHDNDMVQDIGVDKRIEDITAEEAVSYVYKGSDQHIATLDDAARLCSELGLGIQLDIKGDGSDVFFKAIAEIIQKYDLEQGTHTISTHPHAYTYLDGIALLRLTEDEITRIHQGAEFDASGKFWFGWPRHIENDFVKVLQERGALVIPSINVFHYPEEEHMERAKADIERMMEAGVDAFQIDSVYDVFF